MAQGTPETMRTLALRHLPADDAERWLGLLRPAVRLLTAGDKDPVAARLGGIPALPAEWDWPVWEGHGPLSFVASVDCAALPSGVLDIEAPTDGTLLFFYFDGQFDDGRSAVLVEDPATRPGARVLHVPAAAATVPRATPAGLTPFPEVSLTALPTMTAAEPWHPSVREVFAPGAPTGQYEHPVCGDDFGEALWDTEEEEGPSHRVGGHAHSIQNPVEYEVARAALGADTDGYDDRIHADARNWVLLAQFDSDDDSDMMWGDAGILYWLIRREDLAALRFDRAEFNWQCS
ncbi:YwqG family protein [Streptomyces qinzhouensis]|uniref:DUF1963 domain-containing protein n=1 Tax=Streptomyces qinzhouensis TaxID=2599401 RepID=A0A5B8J5Y4_9ACTN|nr:YwqG family protein [Streptomyces qinzhouensis]QDY77215.1 DUF1963 domain-containing protein [Streptomyces qinzhouensis]